MLLNQKEIKLSADLYDALEFAALEYGGIGKFSYFDQRLYRIEEINATPCCIQGYTFFVTNTLLHNSYSVVEELAKIGLSTMKNDTVICEWQRKNKLPVKERMPWDLYVKAMNIIRVPNDAN